MSARAATTAANRIRAAGTTGLGQTGRPGWSAGHAVPARTPVRAGMERVLEAMLEVTKGRGSAPPQARVTSPQSLFAATRGIGIDTLLRPDLRVQDWLATNATGILLQRFLQIFRLGREDMSSFLEITPKTLQARERTPRLPFVDAERIARYVRTWLAGADTFEDPDYANRWLHASNQLFGDKTPFELLRGADGERAVLAELVRIEHGLPV